MCIHTYIKWCNYGTRSNNIRSPFPFRFYFVYLARDRMEYTLFYSLTPQCPAAGNSMHVSHMDGRHYRGHPCCLARCAFAWGRHWTRHIGCGHLGCGWLVTSSKHSDGMPALQARSLCLGRFWAAGIQPDACSPLEEIGSMRLGNWGVAECFRSPREGYLGSPSVLLRGVSKDFLGSERGGSKGWRKGPFHSLSLCVGEDPHSQRDRPEHKIANLLPPQLHLQGWCRIAPATLSQRPMSYLLCQTLTPITTVQKKQTEGIITQDI